MCRVSSPAGLGAGVGADGVCPPAGKAPSGGAWHDYIPHQVWVSVQLFPSATRGSCTSRSGTWPVTCGTALLGVV